MVVKKPELYKYEWYDHFSRTGWIKPEEGFLKPYLIKGIGYLIYEDKQHYAFTQGLTPDGQCNDMMVVLKCALKSKTKVR